MTTDPAATPPSSSIYLGEPRDPNAGMELVSLILAVAAVILGGLTCLGLIATFWGQNGMGYGFTYSARGFSPSMLQRVQSLGPVISSVGAIPSLLALGALLTGRSTGRRIAVIAFALVLLGVVLAVLRSQTTFTI